MNIWYLCILLVIGIVVVCGLLFCIILQVFSYCEVFFIFNLFKVDVMDFYVFCSYEFGCEGYVMLIVDYFLLQDVYGGLNYFDLDKNVVYDIYIDNNGDVKEDIIYCIQFDDIVQDFVFEIEGKIVFVLLKNIGFIGLDKDDIDNFNVCQQYKVI